MSERCLWVSWMVGRLMEEGSVSWLGVFPISGCNPLLHGIERCIMVSCAGYLIDFSGRPPGIQLEARICQSPNHGFVFPLDSFVVLEDLYVCHFHQVHGRNDLICPPRNAWMLCQRLPLAKLVVVPLAAHSSSFAPAFKSEIVRAINSYAWGLRIKKIRQNPSLAVQRWLTWVRIWPLCW